MGGRGRLHNFLTRCIRSLFLFSISVCLRIQTNPQNRSDFLSITPERAFGDFVFAHVVLHLVVINFIG